jgi:hypothetical protein
MHVSWQRTDQQLIPKVIKAGKDWLLKQSAIGVWNMNSSPEVHHGRPSGVFCASLGQMKNQKELLVYVM